MGKREILALNRKNALSAKIAKDGAPGRSFVSGSGGGSPGSARNAGHYRGKRVGGWLQLVGGNGAAGVEGRFDQEHERDHGQANDAENPEDINKGEHGGLALEFSVEHGASLLQGGGGSGTLARSVAARPWSASR